MKYLSALNIVLGGGGRGFCNNNSKLIKSSRGAAVIAALHQNIHVLAWIVVAILFVQISIFTSL